MLYSHAERLQSVQQWVWKCKGHVPSCVLAAHFPRFRLLYAPFTYNLENLQINLFIKNCFLYLFFLHILHLNHSFPSPLSSQSCRPHPLFLTSLCLLSLKKRASLSMILSYNKTRHTRSYEDWMRQFSMRIRFPKADKRVRENHLLLLEVLQGHQPLQPWQMQRT